MLGLGSPGRQQEVDCLAAAVDGAIKIHPSAFDLHIRLVHPPGAVAHAQVRPDPFLQFGRIGLNPAEDGGVAHRTPRSSNMISRSRQLIGNIRYHRTDRRMTSAVNCRPLGGLILRYLDRLSAPRHPTDLPCRGRYRKAATEPFKALFLINLPQTPTLHHFYTYMVCYSKSYQTSKFYLPILVHKLYPLYLVEMQQIFQGQIR